VGFAEFRQSAVARVGVGFDVEQIENRESLAFDGQMVPLDALAMNFTLKGEIAAQCRQRLAQAIVPRQAPPSRGPDAAPGVPEGPGRERACTGVADDRVHQQVLRDRGS